jgi:RAD51-like protein 2
MVPPLGRSAAELISINKRFSSSCAPLDRLLGGGLPSGYVLELSGPPGTAKETLATKFASDAVSSNDQVLFVGKMATEWAPLLHPYCILDMQNMASPASIHSELGRPSAIHHASTSRWFPLGSKDASLDLVHYLNIFTLPDLLIFLHNLPLFLETHASVNGFTITCQVLADGKSLRSAS